MRVTRLRNQAKKHLVHAYRRRVGPVGVLPDFLLIGVPRGGTTACFRQLVRHPQVGAPLEKELLFLDHRWSEGERFYRRCFPTARQMAANGWRITGEATPRYLHHPDAAGRAASLVPEARLIVLLRDPVLRAWSHYRLFVERGQEERSFEQTIDDEIAHPLDPRMSQGPSYLSLGVYDVQFRRWLAHFPRERFLVVRSEEYFADNAAVQERIQRHLGIDPFIPPVVRLNPSGSGGQRLEPASAARLRAYFAPSARATSEMLGIDLDW